MIIVILQNGIRKLRQRKYNIRIYNNIHVPVLAAVLYHLIMPYGILINNYACRIVIGNYNKPELRIYYYSDIQVAVKNNKAVMVDVRNKKAIIACHIPGSKNLSVTASESKQRERLSWVIF